jgi:hypothetical protein
MTTLKEMLAERGEQYGDFKDMADTAQALKEMPCRDSMTNVEKEAWDLICTKMARIVHGNPHNRDSWADIAGYAQLVVTDMDRQDGI